MIMFDALSPQRRRLVLGVGALVLLLITAIAVVACCPDYGPTLFILSRREIPARCS
jgi:hypothetical protein